jgi:hypothetical protein
MRVGDMAKAKRKVLRRKTASYRRPVGADIRSAKQVASQVTRDFAQLKPTFLVTLLGSNRTECPLP